MCDDERMRSEGRFQIGEVAEQVGLSVKTIRRYDELDVVVPSARSTGGFRLYTTEDVERLRLVKALRFLKYAPEEMVELLELVDVATGDAIAADRQRRLDELIDGARERCDEMRQRLRGAEDAMIDLDRRLRSGSR